MEYMFGISILGSVSTLGASRQYLYYFHVQTSVWFVA